MNVSEQQHHHQPTNKAQGKVQSETMNDLGLDMSMSEELLEKFEMLSYKYSECCKLYKNYPVIVDNEKSFYENAKKFWSLQLELTKDELNKWTSTAPIAPDVTKNKTAAYLRHLKLTSELISRRYAQNEDMY